jgi:hypothetical protein
VPRYLLYSCAYAATVCTPGGCLSYWSFAAVLFLVFLPGFLCCAVSLDRIAAASVMLPDLVTLYSRGAWREHGSTDSARTGKSQRGRQECLCGSGMKAPFRG